MTDVIPGSLHQAVAPGVGWQEIGIRQTDCSAMAPLRQAEDRQVPMNAVQDRHGLPQMKASDTDRDAVVAALSEHFQAGRLTREELDGRTERALTARTLNELDELTADLPAIRPAGPAPVVRPRGPGYPLRAPVAAAFAALAIAALMLGVGEGRYGWDWWWVIPAGLFFVRRAGRAGRCPPGLRAELTAERNGTAAPTAGLRREPSPEPATGRSSVAS
jgi:Domain of unknown function (DUF1707)